MEIAEDVIQDRETSTELTRNFNGFRKKEKKPINKVKRGSRCKATSVKLFESKKGSG